MLCFERHTVFLYSQILDLMVLANFQTNFTDYSRQVKDIPLANISGKGY